MGSFWKAIGRAPHLAAGLQPPYPRARELAGRHADRPFVVPGLADAGTGRQFLPYAQETIKAAPSAMREEFRMLTAGAPANEIRIATQHSLSISPCSPRVVGTLLESGGSGSARRGHSNPCRGSSTHFDALANGVVHVPVTYGDDAATAAGVASSRRPRGAHAGHGRDGAGRLRRPWPAPPAPARPRERPRGRCRSSPTPAFSFSEKLVAPLVRALGDRLKVVCEGGLERGAGGARAARPGRRVAARADDRRRPANARSCSWSAAPEYRVPLTIKAYRMKTVRAPVLDAMWSLLAARAAS